MTTEELLATLGWPLTDLEAKGTLVWQAPIKDIERLPPTASLTVMPKTVRAKVINVDASKDIEPHFEAEWDISGETPVLKKHILAGVDLTQKSGATPAESFASLVLLVKANQPKIDIMGYRNKGTQNPAQPQDQKPAPAKLQD